MSTQIDRISNEFIQTQMLRLKMLFVEKVFISLYLLAFVFIFKFKSLLYVPDAIDSNTLT